MTASASNLPSSYPLATDDQDLATLLGPPSLLEGEDPVAYEKLSKRVIEAIQPKDLIERIFARDFVDLFWEATRLKTFKATIMRLNAHAGLKVILDSAEDPISARKLAKEWAANDVAALKKVRQKLQKMGLDENAIAAQTLQNILSRFAVIDGMMRDNEARRYLLLREVDRRRDAASARRFREVHTIEAEFKEVVSSQKRDSSDASLSNGSQ